MGRGSRIGAPCYNAGESLNEPSNLKLFWLNFQMEFVESSPSQISAKFDDFDLLWKKICQICWIDKAI